MKLILNINITLRKIIIFLICCHKNELNYYFKYIKKQNIIGKMKIYFIIDFIFY